VTPWTAPSVTRDPGPRVGDERTLLEARLEEQRRILLHNCAGLDADQLKTRSAEPSTLTLLGLVRHLAVVERWWFRQNFAGLELPDLFSFDRNPDAEFDDVDDADAAADFARYAEEVELARQVVAGAGLDDTFRSATHPLVDRPPMEINLRWVFLNMIEEYARHNGHADLLRERIDGVTGS